MRVGNFSVMIPEGRERDSGHVEMAHGAVYKIQLQNLWYNRRCDATVSVDGKEIGCFRVGASESITLERPAHDTGRFTFFKADSAEGQSAGVANIGRDDRGLIQVVFRPEKRRTPPPMQLCSTPRGVKPRGLEAEEKTYGGMNVAGVTGLTGQSAQTFHEVRNLDYDPTEEVTITLRLVVGGQAVRELQAVVKGNPIPAPAE